MNPLKVGQRHLESRVSKALDPDEAIRRYRHCVFTGDPGAGKTTLLKYLALQSVQKQLTDLPDLPIHVRLNEFVKSGYRDLLEFAAECWDSYYGFPKEDAYRYMYEALQKGQAFLLLDALDETVMGKSNVEAEESYRRVAETIMRLQTRYSQSPIVVTARKAGYHGYGQLVGFTELEVLDFRPEDSKQFIGKWFDQYHQQQKLASAADLISRLERNPRMQALAANPLLLSLIVLVYQAQLDLPDQRAKLYQRCVEILLNEWDSTRGIQRRRAFKPEYKQQLLEEIAWHFHCQGQRYFADAEVHTVIATFLPTVGLSATENKDILAEIANENGLLKEQAQSWYGFLHLTLQEYFVAKYATDHQELTALLSHRGDPWWEEVLLLYAGQVPDASALFQQLLGLADGAALQEDIFHTNLLLAGRCLAARPIIKHIDLRQEVVDRLFTLLLSTPHTLTKQQAAEVLVSVSKPEVTERLLHFLTNQHIDTSVPVSILDALGSLGDKSIVPQLLAFLPDPHINAYVRGSIAVALGKLIDDAASVKKLATLMLNSNTIDSIHRALWNASRRARVRVFVRDEAAGKCIELEQW